MCCIIVHKLDNKMFIRKIMIYTSHELLLGSEIKSREKGEPCSTHG